MKFDHHFTRDVLVIIVPDDKGHLFPEEIHECIGEILTLCGDSTRKVAFNMSGKSYLQSSGLGDLVKIKDALLDRNIGLILTDLSPRVRSLIEMVGVNQFFDIVISEDEIG
jgi:anti-anti-sigma factor